ncbi:GDSL-type esterase/lipase family protein [Paenibacillus qinlingensis]|uniref:SGNH hydrolase-type esterase domain-containing protein n=1 Tax=Paenibacillus qinlingensis TaxID=1837343 RepID=A0ABU1NS96_9BACL|nr:GDSL-type esterase/lipase family protein [Paenibacillus qinlingensis]MDR6550319.1 hypothetical protein [Paenibacillus qinlingensis]
MTVIKIGAQVVPTSPPTMDVLVLPGRVETSDMQLSWEDVRKITIRWAGDRQFVKQVYHIRGESGVSPCGWNGEGIRGSGGYPYQRMVPGTLKVYNKSRDLLYVPNQDYTFDYYWGTIKRHPQGQIAEGEELSLDYVVWLCRYDAIVLQKDGQIVVVEGDTEAPESRELLLPEPPAVEDGLVLAHVFTGWGNSSIDGGSRTHIEMEEEDLFNGALPILSGRYEDTVHRMYIIEVQEILPEGCVNIRIAATGEDYGTGNVLTEDTVRWTDSIVCKRNEPIPLVYKSAYGHDTDWGLALNLASVQPTALTEKRRFYINASPQLIFNLSPTLSDPLDVIPIEQTEQLMTLKEKLTSGESVRIAFFGESTTRSGLWPYMVMSDLRKRYARSKIFSSNVAIGGEGTRRGIHRLDHEVLCLEPDLVVLEYLINDACSGDTAAIEQTLRNILGRIRVHGSACLIITNNGMNPVFTPHGNTRNFYKFHHMYRRLAQEYDCAFVGAFDYFAKLHEYGKHYLTELKGNMVNHPYGNEDLNWGPFDTIISKAVNKAFGADE